MALAGASVAVTAVAVLGGVGLIPDVSAAAGETTAAAPDRVVDGTTSAPAPGRAPAGDAAEPEPAGATSEPSGATRPEVGRERHDAPGSAAEAGLPADSGSGRRAVFSEELQRVWLVDADDEVLRTYLVSGSLTDNLQPGTYEVWSRSEQAWGIDDSGTMRWFVRFAHGKRAAIGFHDIPVDDGQPVQTVDELGTPLSHGCIRQRRADAKRLWDFAPLGTKVVVTA
jgi:hypothetical protein